MKLLGRREFLEGSLLTPIHHVFEMCTPHIGAKNVRAVFSVPQIKYDRNGKSTDF